MSDLTQFSLALRAFQQVPTGSIQVPAPQDRLLPNLPASLDGVGPLPENTLLFGIAGDGKPLLLSLSNPRPGPILVAAERGSGKTHFLKMLLLAAQRLVAPGEVQFVVITGVPDDFAHLQAPDHLLGVWPAYDVVSTDLLYQLACRVEAAKNQRPVLLLIDGLDAIFQLEASAQENLAYILAHGPDALVWPVVTANADLLINLPDWLACFRTRIYGRITNPGTIEALTSVPGAPLNSLLPGAQFCLREQSRWLKFWLPMLPA